MAEKKKILFVCTYNKMRSKTAEAVYKDDDRFQVKSAGVDDFAAVPVSLELLAWADIVLVMEEDHRQWLEVHFPMVVPHIKIICLDIPDLYGFMNEELIELVKKRVEKVFAG